MNQTCFIPDEFISNAHSETAIPALIIIYVLFNLINLLVGLFLVERSRSRFMLIWFLTLLFSGVILFGLIMLPSLTQWITDLFI